jgi:hypothetical protein
MIKSRFRTVLALALLAVALVACHTVPPPTDSLTGTWYQNGGPIDLIWEFTADGTVTVHAWSGPGIQHGIYRHLQANRVALDFGGDAVSVVQITVAGREMTMINPNGTRTALNRQ